MKWFLIILALLIGLPLLANLIGAFIPRTLCTRRSILIARSPKAVWVTLSDLRGHPSWRPELKEVSRVGGDAKQPIWREQFKEGGHIDLQTIEATPAQRLHRRIANPRGAQNGDWICELQEHPKGCELSITERSDISAPAQRLALRLSRQQKKSVDFMLKRIAKLFS